MKKLAILQFPGSNCEYETLRAFVYYGAKAELVKWNESPDILAGYEGYVLPGGFSFQDRVRAGAIAAKLPVMDIVQKAAEAGKPVLGICNGCQILSQTGLFPNTQGDNKLEIALAHNTKNGKPLGFVCDWVEVKIENPQNSVFTRYFNDQDILPIPINHGEGRFVGNTLVSDQRTVLRYASTNPNGSDHNIAGLCNAKGNVLGIMPHPERGAFLKQVPYWIPGAWGKAKYQLKNKPQMAVGPWEKLFVSVADYLK